MLRTGRWKQQQSRRPLLTLIERKEMFLLEQSSYPDGQGNSVNSSEIKYLGTFKYQFDGFFRWQCGNCQEEHQSRSWRINGTICKCSKCQESSLLLRTDCQQVNNIIAASEKRTTDLEQKVRRCLNYLGQAISSLNN